MPVSLQSVITALIMEEVKVTLDTSKEPICSTCDKTV